MMLAYGHDHVVLRLQNIILKLDIELWHALHTQLRSRRR